MMQQIKPYLTMAQSSDALYVSFGGVHADELTARYAAELDKFCQQLAGKRWARNAALKLTRRCNGGVLDSRS